MASQAPADSPAPEEAQAVIGRFRLLEKLGEGGFGAVFVAEQKHPIKRRVALKIIKLGMDTREVIARFEAERQALAMMDHPNIAKVFDAGATDTGRPYFAMELVRGIPITDYCDKNKVPPVDRINLFIDVCHAIQHAHQKGVIHRDIKPSNILVTLHDGRPVPKVIDFGIAKATQGDLTDKTVYTQFQQFVGTPAYMSPEQAEMSGLDIDTRSDIYSLGVLLYELLTGTTPFDAKDLAKAGMDEMRRQIRETDPARPSNRLTAMSRDTSTATATRLGMEPNKLVALLRGDLDWIVMKCLEKDRTRRYESASGLALDIQRYLNDETVSAHSPSSIYRFQKLVRRNKIAFVAGGMVVLAILLGLGLATVGFFRAQAAEKLANDNFRQARAAVEDLLHIADEQFKDEAGMQPLRMKLMKAVIDQYEPFLAQPLADPTPRAQLARFYVRYGFLILYGAERSRERDAAVLEYFEKARRTQEQLLKEHPGDQSLRSDLGWTLIMEIWRPLDPPVPPDTGARAIEVFRKLVAEDPRDPFARDDLGWAIYRVFFRSSDPAHLPLAAEGVAILEQLVKEYPMSVEFRRDLANLLSLYERRLRPNPTTQEAEQALPIYRRCLQLYQDVNADVEAERPGIRQPERPSHAAARIVSPSRHYTKRDVAFGNLYIARMEQAQQKWNDAASSYDRAARIMKEVVEQSPTVASFADELANYFQARADASIRAGHAPVAAAHWRDTVEFWKRQADLHPDIPRFRELADAGAKQVAELAKKLANSTTAP